MIVKNNKMINIAKAGILVAILLILMVFSANAETSAITTAPVMPAHEIVIYFATAMIAGIAILICTLFQYCGDNTMRSKIRHFSKIFKRAKEYIHIQTDLDKKFFDNTEITNALATAAAMGVEIQILVDPEGEKIGNVPKLKELVDKKVVEIKVAKAPFREAKIPHFMVVDSKTVRLETYHKG
jgi:phosphatidylserine/phosphatidylglycerophosphate/cardiolipin synthase-like enzyme